jgi:hypothetical protein
MHNNAQYNNNNNNNNVKASMIKIQKGGVSKKNIKQTKRKQTMKMKNISHQPSSESREAMKGVFNKKETSSKSIWTSSSNSMMPSNSLKAFS